MRSTDPPELNSWVARYLAYLQSEKRRSPNTIDAVRQDLSLIETDPLSISTDQLKAVLARRRAQGIAASSLARTASTWRVFYRYLVGQGVLESNPAQVLKAPKKPSRLPKVVGMDALQAVLLKPWVDGDWEMARAQMLVDLLYFTGLRVSEAVNLEWASETGLAQSHWVCLKRKELQVLGKGGKSRLMPVMRVLAERLQGWRNICLEREKRMGWPGSSSVFKSSRGQTYTARMAQRDVERFGLLMGLEQHLHPHMLRHSFGSHMLQESQNLRAVQELLGHSSIASTQVYTSLDFKHLASVYDTAFPRARKKDD